MPRKVNIASGNDVVAVQVGRVHQADDTPAEAHTPESTTTVNIRTGNARVGMQADEVHGPIVIRF